MIGDQTNVNNYPVKMDRVKEAITDEEIMGCWEATFALRTHVKHDEFLARIKEQQKEGFHLLFVESTLVPGTAAAILGYRVFNYLHSGKTLYIDDLSTMPTERGKGYAGKLLDHINVVAAELRCDNITLDSGYHRQDAHRLYLNKGFFLESHHVRKNFAPKKCLNNL